MGKKPQIRDRSYEDQLHRVNGLQLLISVIVIWNTVYIEKRLNYYDLKEWKFQKNMCNTFLH